MVRRRRSKRRLFLALILIGIFFSLPWVQRVFYPFPYRDAITFEARVNGLDPRLIAAVARVESKFNPGVVSPKGAVGLMQLMPETARDLAGQRGLPFNGDMLFQPEYNLKLGSFYLRQLLDEFDGKLPPALAAYNGGKNRVTRWLREGQWDGKLESVENIPFEETKNFVLLVMGNYRAFQRLYKP